MPGGNKKCSFIRLWSQMKLKLSSNTECHSICHDDDSRAGLCITSPLESSAAHVIWQQIVNAVWLLSVGYALHSAFSRLLASAVEYAEAGDRKAPTQLDGGDKQKGKHESFIFQRSTDLFRPCKDRVILFLANFRVFLAFRRGSLKIWFRTFNSKVSREGTILHVIVRLSVQGLQSQET